MNFATYFGHGADGGRFFAVPGPAVTTSLAREFLRGYVRTRKDSALISWALMLFAAGALFTLSPPVLAISWSFSVAAAHAFLLISVRLCRARLDEPSQPTGWKTIFWFGEFAYNLAWASLFYIFPLASHFPAEGTGAALLLVFCLNCAICAQLSNIQTLAASPVLIVLASLQIARWPMLDFTQLLVFFGLFAIFVTLGHQSRTNERTTRAYKVQMAGLLAELEQAHAISEEARRRAESTSRAKSHFLATISHELRTPLNAILGFSEIMKDQVFGRIDHPQYCEYVEDIHNSGRHLLALIDEILDLSRIESGQYKLSESQLMLADCLGECTKMLAVRAQEKKIRLHMRIDGELPPIRADGRALRQIFLNILSNAVKFTPAGGRVDIDVSREDDGGQTIRLCDTGPGIPEAERELVLQPFAQGSLATRHAERGSGLGLAIVVSLVAMHGGTFELGAGPRGGTQAMIRFPGARNADTPTHHIAEMKERCPAPCAAKAG